MKLMALMAACIAVAVSGCTKEPQAQTSGTTPTVALARSLEVGCGMCIYDMEGMGGCELAAKVDGKTVLVTGVDVDLHDEDLCSAPKNAMVTGTVEGDKLVVTEVKF